MHIGQAFQASSPNKLQGSASAGPFFLFRLARGALLPFRDSPARDRPPAPDSDDEGMARLPMPMISENLTFFRQFLRSPKMVGSIIPTSGYVIDRLLSQVDWQATDVFVEYGPGVGTFTRPILDRLRPDARLIAIDTCRDFIDHLAERIDDPRLRLVHGSAADVESILARHAEGRKADYVASGLPFSTLPPAIAREIMAATARALAPGGTFLIYQYSLFVLPLLAPHFPSVNRSRVWRNIPPCHVFAARKAAEAGTAAAPAGRAIRESSGAA